VLLFIESNIHFIISYKDSIFFSCKHTRDSSGGERSEAVPSRRVAAAQV